MKILIDSYLPSFTVDLLNQKFTLGFPNPKPNLQKGYMMSGKS